MLRLGHLPAPWQQYIHPDGKPYFHHLEWNLVTEANIRDPTIYTAIQSLFSRINDWKDKISLPESAKPSEQSEVYVVLNSRDASQGSYYCVDHHARQVFWLEDLALTDIMPVGVPPDSSFGAARKPYKWPSSNH